MKCVKGLVLLHISMLVDSFRFDGRLLQRISPTKVMMAPAEVMGGSVEVEPKPAELETTVEMGLRKWFLIKNKRRPDVVQTSTASSIAEIMVEAWKAVLVSVRVLNTDVTLASHTSLLCFSKFNLTIEDVEKLGCLTEMVKTHLAESAEIFQPNLRRTFAFQFQTNDDPDWQDGPTLIMTMETFRGEPETVFAQDMEEMEPSLENIVTNDIPGFPFDSVYDFISEVNRPIDAYTLANLKFTYTLSDLKFDPSKLKNKKDPKEIVTTINARLTRLQKWKDLLMTRDGTDYKDNDMVYWSEKTKNKYRSLMSLVKLDPKRAMDTQYDKRKVFITIIDRWSERLKKVFKYQFISKRKPVDFKQAILESEWRASVIDTCSVIAQAPFLNLQGPSFTPGVIPPLFPQEFPLSANFPMSQVMYEMLTWLQYVETAKHAAGLTEETFGTINQHVYTRGLITERALYDVWTGLASWLKDDEAPSKHPLLLDANALISEVSGGAISRAARAATSDAADHTDEFLESLATLNAFARNRSNKDARSVKELFKGWNADVAEFVDWWTTIVRDLGLTDDLDKLTRDASAESPLVWSEVVDDVMRRRVEAVNPGQAVADVNSTLAREAWDRLKPAVVYAETVGAALPWRQQHAERASVTALATLVTPLQKELKKETVTLHFDPEKSSFGGDESDKKSLLVVLPRLFPGYGKSEAALAEEMGAFLEFYRIIVDDVQALGLAPSRDLTVTPLHPLLEDAEGRKPLAGRSPHPSLLFTMNKHKNNTPVAENIPSIPPAAVVEGENYRQQIRDG